ncbi:unnamed protein product [Nezara viridula]|uniref:Uncharacterized protein n=1 Tax=Nezara viridula TaxID=85310 RepID=A0A9P0HBB2_NEZVI|nr:unnamed protein product [Nezara viridula]
MKLKTLKIVKLINQGNHNKVNNEFPKMIITIYSGQKVFIHGLVKKLKKSIKP